jgi:hypothetical protein
VKVFLLEYSKERVVIQIGNTTTDAHRSKDAQFIAQTTPGALGNILIVRQSDPGHMIVHCSQG